MLIVSTVDRRYRVVVKKGDGGEAWTALPRAGAQVFHQDYMGGGTMGGAWRDKRLPDEPGGVPQYGYNQVAFQGGWPLAEWHDVCD